MALEELSFESVNGWMDNWTVGQMDDGQKMIPIAPEHSSGELKSCATYPRCNINWQEYIGQYHQHIHGL